MKKILITLLLLTFYCNNSFAGSHSFIEQISEDNKRTMNDASYAFLYKGKLKCQPYKNIVQNSKDLKAETCHNSSGISIIRITNLKTKEVQEYGWTNMELATTQLF